MHVVIQIMSEVHSSRKVTLRNGEKIKVGRASSNDVSFRNDPNMSREHFRIEFSNQICQLQNVKQKNVTFINGRPVVGVIQVQDGDQIIAGQTRFKVTVVDQPSTKPATPVEPAAAIPDPFASGPDPGAPDSVNPDLGKEFGHEMVFTDADPAQFHLHDDESSEFFSVGIGPAKNFGHELVFTEPDPADIHVPEDESGEFFSVGMEPPELFASELFLSEPNPGEFYFADPQPADVFIAEPESVVLEPPAPVSSETAEPDPAETKNDVSLDAVKERVFAYFCQLTNPLFAILDAARDPMVLPLLMQSEHEYQSLYEGTKGDALAGVAPYLVKLPPDSTLLSQLVDQGWGNSWGIYLTSDQSFNDVRKHFRKFLMVEMPDGEKVYFRFYDPRVLRDYLPTCSPEQTEKLYGPVRSYYVEDKQPEKLIRFTAKSSGAAQVIPFSAELELQSPRTA